MNFRSTPAIVAACRAIIAPNYAADGAAAKAMTAHRKDGPPVQLVECSSIEAEYERIAAEVDAWYAAGIALAKGSAGKGAGMAVLFWRYADVTAFASFMRNHWSGRSGMQVAASREEGGDDAESPEAEAPQGALYISTIHGVKGLEYEIVFLAGLGVMVPSERSSYPTSWVKHLRWTASTSADRDRQAALAEARRMLFVAASRPVSLLHVSYAGGAEDRCEAVADLRRALQSSPPQRLQELRCCTAAAAAPGWLSARQLAEAPRSSAELMGEDED